MNKVATIHRRFDDMPKSYDISYLLAPRKQKLDRAMLFQRVRMLVTIAILIVITANQL